MMSTSAQAREVSKSFWMLVQEADIAYETFARHRGITTPTLSILDVLFHEGACTQRDLCVKTLLPKQTVNSIVQAMAQNRHVELVPCPADKRAKDVCLTEAGRSFAEEIIGPSDDAEAEAFSQFSDQEQQQMLNMTRRFVDAYCKALEAVDQKARTKAAKE